VAAVRGRESADTGLDRATIHRICAEALAELPLDGRRVLVLVPDHTRHAPIDLFFSIFAEVLHDRVQALDVLVATGTHAPMEPDRLDAHLGITRKPDERALDKVHLFNHQHDDRASLATLDALPASEVSQLTAGLFTESIPIAVNRKVLEYDHILIVSPVVPHEAMGFAGGNKYFFPGVAGLEVVEAFHWLAAVITNPAINGVKDTPTRRVIDRVVQAIPTPRTCFAFAIDAHHELACLFVGAPEDAWSRAADVSERLHIRFVDRPYARVLGLTPAIYEELWVAGKAMYKLENVVADGGELVIYGPQIREVSFVHGAQIERIGYHVRDYFVKQWDRFSGDPKLILAHSTNVRGVGTFEEGVERPRVRVTLATGIAREVCERINLGYCDHRGIDVDAWRTAADTLVVDRAGQDLYRLRGAH
jgi:nickel-dependent lactate racemase